MLNLQVLRWILGSASVFIAVGGLVIFQPELRRALIQLGQAHFFRGAHGRVEEMVDALVDSGDAEANPSAPWQQSGRGRPAKRYRLTAAGRAKLEHTYDDLASAAMRQLREIGGDEAVRNFARRRVQAILDGVARVDSDKDGSVADAAGRVADALTRAGYATTATRVGGPIQGIEICQHHCPVSHVAEEFPELCQAEQQAISEVLGTHVQRLASIVNGDCACTTHVPLTTTTTDEQGASA